MGLQAALDDGEVFDLGSTRLNWVAVKDFM